MTTSNSNIKEQASNEKASKVNESNVANAETSTAATSTEPNVSNFVDDPFTNVIGRIRKQRFEDDESSLSVTFEKDFIGFANVKDDAGNVIGREERMINHIFFKGNSFAKQMCELNNDFNTVYLDAEDKAEERNIEPKDFRFKTPILNGLFGGATVVMERKFVAAGESFLNYTYKHDGYATIIKSVKLTKKGAVDLEDLKKAAMSL